MGRLEGKRALVTGAAGSVGAALARRFAAEGARVLIADIALEEGRSIAEELGDAATPIALDVTSEDAWAQAMETAQARWGGLDLLVNNAAIASSLVPIEARTPTEWDRIMAVNLRGPFLGVRAALPLFRRAGAGAIVNIASVAGLGQSEIMDPAYACSKAGLTMLTRVTAAQHARDGVRCNSVHPGPIDSALARAAYADSTAFESRLSRVPIGRLATIAEVVAATLYLASDESSYITGVALSVDGGALVQ